ncbi:MAG: FAD-binding oxidoreductase, partial [Gammaproteobacteria bacterium]
MSPIVRICCENGIGMVPQGGNTGYCGGATPDDSGSQLVLSLERLNRVLEVDAGGHSMTLEAGVILANAQRAAAEHGLLFPLSMGSEGSCQIGGNLSTNAGGVAVLKYGTAGDLVLGLEVVLPDGRILPGLSALRKDNTGYDLKRLFLGAEGTLGIITAAVVKLFPRTRSSCVAWAAVTNIEAACELLARLRAESGDTVTSFEYVSSLSLAHVIAARTD